MHERESLNGEPVTRRDYLGMAGMGSAAAAIAFCTVGMLRLPRPRILPDVVGLLRLGKPDQFPTGSATMLPDQKVCVLSSDEGIGVLSLVCTHLGCIVNKVENEFHCPCHGSKFAAKGDLIQGPAPRPMRWLAVSEASDGTLLVDVSKEVPLGTLYKASS